MPVGIERREELPGANTPGDSLEQARANIQTTIQLALEANECFKP